MSRTIGRHSSSKVTSSNTKKRIRTSRQEHNEKRDGISFSSCIWTRTTNKKVALFVPLSCFHWHISCHFWTFGDITETPGSAWSITESDSSFPLCSLNAIKISVENKYLHNIQEYFFVGSLKMDKKLIYY